MKISVTSGELSFDSSFLMLGSTDNLQQFKADGALGSIGEKVGGPFKHDGAIGTLPVQYNASPLEYQLSKAS